MYIFIRHDDRKKTRTIKHHKEKRGKKLEKKKQNCLHYTIYDKAYAKAKLC